jgi:hypothetical protein
MSSNIATTKSSPVTQAVLYGAIAIAAVGTAVLLFNFGSSERAAVEQSMLREIDSENKIFCEKFHMGSSAEQLNECAGYLAEIRKREDERISAAQL